MERSFVHFRQRVPTTGRNDRMKLNASDNKIVETLVQYFQKYPSETHRLGFIEDLLCSLRDVAVMLEADPALNTSFLELSDAVEDVARVVEEKIEQTIKNQK